MYKVAIAGSGLVQYQGLKHVLIEGSQQSRVSQATVHELREAIDKSGFLSFDLPSRGCPDAEVIGLTVMMDGIEKSIQTSPHCYDSTDPLSGLSAGDFEGVDRLVRLLKDVDRLSGDVKWVGTPEERKQKKEAEREAFERARDSKIAALESQFETGDSMQRKHSAVQLMRYQTRVDEVLPYVLEALEDPDQGLRRDAARSLESMAQHRKLREWGLSISRREVVSALKRALDDPYKPVRDTAAQALGSMGPEASSAAAQLASMAREADPGVRRNALEALVKLGSSAGPAVPILVEIFPESQGSHRSSILRILGNAGPASAAVSLSVLIASLQDPDPSCRSQSARSLALLGSAASPSLAALTEVANSDPNDHVRRTAGKAITEIEADQ